MVIYSDWKRRLKKRLFLFSLQYGNIFYIGLCYYSLMDAIRALVSDELNYLEKEFCEFASNNTSVFKDLECFLQGKSKRIRSLLCLLYLKTNNVDISKEILDLLFACELIHNASLLHDDVVDDSVLRRGTQTLYDKYGAKLSVISGDYILSVAVDKLMGLNNNGVLTLLFGAVKSMSEAEICQYFLRNSEISYEKYLNIIKGKTSSLFSSCLSSAALLSGLDSDIAKAFGDKFGILFQINNDLESDSAANDKKNGVKTAVDILGIEKTLALKDNYKEELKKILVKFPDNRYKDGIEGLIKLL